MPPASPGRLTIWFGSSAITAMTVGFLFQMYGRTEIGFYRMFGTIGLVFIGVFGTLVVRYMFALSGRKVVLGILEQLRPGISLLANVRLDKGVIPAQFVVIGPGGATAVLVDSYESAITRWGRASQDRRSARVAGEMVAALAKRAGGLLPPGTTASALVVTLRRQPTSAAGRGRTWAVAPLDQLRRYLPLQPAGVSPAGGQETQPVPMEVAPAGAGDGQVGGSWQQALRRQLRDKVRRKL